MTRKKQIAQGKNIQVGNWDIALPERPLLLIIFVLAFVLRLVYIVEYSAAPDFENPIGDSQIYYTRSQEIIKGDWLGKEIYFHSSPPYPYFMALIFALSGNNFFVLRLIQSLIGAGNCILIYFLARRLAPGKKLPAFIAGLCAAFYGLFAFFDTDLLMIFLTLFFTDAALLLMLKAKESSKPGYALLAGICVGLAALDKTNIILFTPFAAWFLAGEFSLKWRQWQWKSPAIFVLAVVLMIVPVTVRNYVVGHDLVLVSSNGGVNLYIGNNAFGRGVFILPPDSGLRNTDLYGTSVSVAEQAEGRKLKPSEVSRFWSDKAVKFMMDDPLSEAGIMVRKLVLVWNKMEIPNHLNYYFIRENYVPVLRIMFVGFWLITPLTLVGIVMRWRRGLGPADKLFIAFIIMYLASLLPFFITERYRLPIMPVFIAFAAVTVVEITNVILAREWKRLIVIAAILLAAELFVNWPINEFSYSFNRVIMAAKYLERGLKNPAAGVDDVKTAIVQLKWAIETDPLSTDAHYNLGRAYETVGFYSAALKEWDTTLKIDPGIKEAVQATNAVRKKYEEGGDKVTAAAIPLTPYEQAKALDAQSSSDQAIDLYENIIRQDPFHFGTYNDLGFIYFKSGDYHKAVRYLQKALECSPHNFIVMNNLAGAYFRSGKKKEARRLWEECLKMQPDSELIINQLKMI